MSKAELDELAYTIADEYCSLPPTHRTAEVLEGMLTVAQVVCFTNPDFSMTKFLDRIESRIDSNKKLEEVK